MGDWLIRSARDEYGARDIGSSNLIESVMNGRVCCRRQFMEGGSEFRCDPVRAVHSGASPTG
jgi:hypothetical protein